MNLNAAYTVLVYFSAFSVILPLFLAVRKWPHFLQDSKLLTVYLAASLVTEIVLTYFFFNEVANTVIVNYFSLVEFLLVSLIYHYALNLPRYWKWLFWSCIAGIIGVFCTSNMNGPLNIFNGFYIFLIILFALYYFYKETREVSVQRLADHYFFWFNSAFLIYFGFSFFIFLYEDFIISADRDVARVLWTFHLIANIIYYSILTVGIWKHSGKQP